ncbi:LPS export ABC transporter permease LptG [Geomonas sp. Red32]|uniref:LPS export ABC transporter permease LptG n=1 Tax=Geomonas sp. Red32 TaxID=2912856 RepID=UPI00202CE955|nr:LPS export ABC transporter permease LptG [Geomonas sp. Red32]MCM0084085.1 LPS export ABC transporter permease LptG [Geomonas sp. Red32]
MRILSRYVAKAYLRMLMLCMGAFIAIYLVVDFMEKIARFTGKGGSLYHIVLFFVAKIPEIVNESIPLAVLMATLLTLGTLSMSSELTAMRSCGVSLGRIAAPILGIALAVSVLSLVGGELIIPRSYAQRTYIQEVLIEKKSPSTYFRQHNIWHREEGTILRAALFDPGKGELRGITLWEMRTGTTDPEQRVDATSAVLTPGGWVLKEAVVREFHGGEISATRNAATLPVDLKLKPDDLKVLGKYSDSMTISELRRYCDKLRAGGYDPTRYLAQMHGRISRPFGCAVMAFLGAPFALRSGRSSGIAVGVGLSLAIGFLYVVVNSVILSFGQAGVLPPVVAAWATNFIFLLAGTWLALTLDK